MGDESIGHDKSWCSKCGHVHGASDPCEGARVGTVLDGKYAIVRLLGLGGMGEVYEARHTKIGRPVAVKFLHAQFARHPEGARRFENEARAAGEVQHENIAGVYDVGALPDGAQYLVMELLVGEDLDQVLRREHTLPLARTADLVTQACEGLRVVHARGVIHRDLKPANLFLTRRANGADLVKILDFGIAKLRRPDGDASATGTGVALGTPFYMSPEQARGEPNVGPRSDVYALGVIFYELLSGRRPHEGDSLLQILNNILTRPPRPLEDVCPNLPDAVYRVVGKAMAADAKDRFAGVGELADALAPLSGATYRLSAPSPMARSGSEAPEEVRTAIERRPRTNGTAQSVVGVARNAAPTTRKGARLGLAVLATVGTVAIAIGALVWARGGSSTPAVSRPDVVATVAPRSDEPTPAAEAPPSSAAAAPPAPSSEPLDAGAQPEGSSGRSHARPPKSEPRTNSRRGNGSPPALQSAAPPGAGARWARGASTAPSAAASAAPTKPDCTQTYTIDSEGNKHFRPECFPTK